MNHPAASEKPSWYAVYTKLREEERAARNLQAWGLKTFVPKFKELSRRPGQAATTGAVKYLFPRYIFVRFDSDTALHKVTYTRGVQSVVSFNQKPCPVDDIIIETIQSQMGVEGFIKFEKDIRSGDKVVIEAGPFISLQGTVESEESDSDRLVVILSSVSFQGKLMIEKALVKKVERNH
jgi:transcription antitermination factor NusG